MRELLLFEYYLICGRVAPILKEQIDGGKINLTAIVNTHQLVSLTVSVGNMLISCSATGTTQAAIPRL